MHGLGCPRCCLPPLSPFFAPSVWGQPGLGTSWLHFAGRGSAVPSFPQAPGSAQPLQGSSKPLLGRPAPMWHRLGPIPSTLLDVEFVSTRRVFKPQAPSPLQDSSIPAASNPAPLFQQGMRGDKGSGWVGARGPCQLHVQRCQTRVTRPGPAARRQPRHTERPEWVPCPRSAGWPRVPPRAWPAGTPAAPAPHPTAHPSPTP